ncbi:MAG: GHKL domain-containing protein [Candidatus Marinimicrobia bacterium]|nr:GHKL domain-containing protein [Candidatus Neomarinimicrobiota bacterium]
MSRNLAFVIETASVNAILNYDKIENETANRLITSLKMIRHLESEQKITVPALKEFAQDYNLYKILILDSMEIARHFSFIDQTFEDYWGFHFVPGEPTEKFMAALKRPPGGYYVALTEAYELTAMQRNNGITSLINNLIADSSIIYITIQDTLGIITATENINSLSSILNDDFLQKSLKQDKTLYRKIIFNKQPVYESITPFKVQNVSYGLIRIGLDYQPVANLNRAAVRNAIIRMSLSAMILLILFTYSLMVQKLYVINNEKEKIAAEVYRLQEDIRRKEKITAMGELAAGVAHEIRNPLNAISMSVQRLGKALGPQENSKEIILIKTIRSEIQRVGDIIQQFLAFARPAPLKKSQTDLNNLIETILGIYQAKLENKKIDVHWSPGKIQNISADSEKMKQMLINLLENAINAVMDKGKISISTLQQGEEMIIKIHDNGIGIPKENLTKIFNLYFTTRPEGNGLGLAEVAQIIGNHNGKIEVQSYEKEFTEFTITLPKE